MNLPSRSSVSRRAPWGRPPGPALPRGVMLDLSVSNGGYLTTVKSQPCLTAAFALAAAALIPFPAWAQGGFNGPGRYEIGNVRSGKVIDLDRNRSEEHTSELQS